MYKGFDCVSMNAAFDFSKNAFDFNQLELRLNSFEFDAFRTLNLSSLLSFTQPGFYRDLVQLRFY